MTLRFDENTRLRLAGLLAAAISSLICAEAKAHAFEQRTDYADGESAGNDNYGASYSWSATERNYELSSGTRHSYAMQTFSLSTRVLGTARQLFHASATADTTYSKSGSSAARYSAIQTTYVSVNESTLLSCANSSGCGDTISLPITEFYIASKSISFGILGSETVTSHVLGDFSVKMSVTSTSTKFLGLDTGFLGNSFVTLDTSAHVLSRQFMSGVTTHNYRLLNIDINGEAQAKQGTSLSSAGTTTGSLIWRNREFVDMALMDGIVSFTKSPPIGSPKTVTLVNAPEFLWTGQWIDDVGSTKAF